MELLVFGALFVVGGFASVIYGNYMNTELSYKVYSFLSGKNPGDTWLLLGAIAIIVGFVLVIRGPKKIEEDKRIEQEAGGRYLTTPQKEFLRAYLKQLKDGVISREEYERLKNDLLMENQQKNP